MLAPEEHIFWYTCYPGESFDAVVWSLAGFLAHRGHGEVWEQLQRQQSGTAPLPPCLIFDYLAQSLRTEPRIGRLARLCADPATAARLIVTSRQQIAYVTSEALAQIEGLAPEESAALLANRGATLTADQLTLCTVSLAATRSCWAWLPRPYGPAPRSGACLTI